MKTLHQQWKDREAFREAVKQIEVKELTHEEAEALKAHASKTIGRVENRTPQGQTGSSPSMDAPVFEAISTRVIKSVETK